MTQRTGSERAPRPTTGARLLSDERLARRAAQGDERAFAAIYSRYGQSLYRFCLSTLGNPEDARDALQNTMVKALQALPGEERDIRLKPWLYRVARNESIEILRRRRDAVELPEELSAPSGEPAETAAQRERLRQLLRDLAELPERQRSMLTMRELADLDFDQIGEAFETSPAVVRQTLYEARLSLRQMAEGREMTCEEVMRRLSDADGRVRRRRDIQAHLRACPGCRTFSQAIEERRQDLTALAPLPVIASTGILHAVLSGAQGTSSATGGAGAGTAIATGAGKVAASSALVKSAATVAVVATVAVSADRGGLVDVGLPGGGRGTAGREAASDGAAPIRGGSSAQPPTSSPAQGASGASGNEHPGEGQTGSGQSLGKQAPATDRGAASKGHGRGAEMPKASDHGRQTAAEHGAEPRPHSPRAHSHAPAPSHSSGSEHAHRGASQAHGSPGSKSPGGPAAAGEDSGRAQTDGESQQEAPQPPAAPRKGGSTEPADPLGDKSSAGSAP